VDAATVEAVEIDAWEDMFRAAPAAFAKSAGVSARRVAGALVIQWASTGRRYFSRAIGLGVVEPVTPDDVDAILGDYRDAGIDMFLLQSQPDCRPHDYEEWLRERGLQPFDVQDRVVRGGAPLSSAANGRFTVERVERPAADEWSEFLQRVYRLDTGNWLPELVDRPAWHQYVAREEGRIVGARGMYVGPRRIAWLGMDGPVPGVMTDDYEADAALCARMVADGLRDGARGFIADIEAPSPDRDTPAYGYFERLGFRIPYARTHWRLAG
jgi:hypothetical protein